MPQIATKPALVVDDSKEFRELVEIYCRKEGIDVDQCSSGKELLERLRDLDKYAIVFLDIIMPEIDGFDTLSLIRESYPTLPVVMVTALDDTESILRSLHLGASDFLSKPLDPMRLRAALARVSHPKNGERVEPSLSTELQRIPGIADPIAESEAMQQTLQRVDLVKDKDSTILISGPSGSGKAVVARALHFRSNRRFRPFVAVSCPAFPDATLEAELFGEEKRGRVRHGKIEAAAQGTLFLDEIADLSAEMQAKLLRVLDEGRFTRKGGKEAVRIDCRVVCSANRDLRVMVDDGDFREDLYYRLAAFPIQVPYLRERREDLEALAKAFLKRYRSVEKKRIRGFHPDALDAIRAYHWPGNVRQLENAVHSAVMETQSTLIELDDLPEELQTRPNLIAEFVSVPDAESGDPLDGRTHQLTRKQMPYPPEYIAEAEARTITSRIVFRDPDSVIPLANIERAAILAALKVCGGDVFETSRRLQISRATIYRRLAKYGIDPDDTR